MRPAGHVEDLERELGRKVLAFQALVRQGGAGAIHEIARLKGEIDALKDQIQATSGKVPVATGKDETGELEREIERKTREFMCLVQQQGIAAKDRIASLKAEIDVLKGRLAAAGWGGESEQQGSAAAGKAKEVRE